MTRNDGLTVVLGWDGLDHELATTWDLADHFGAHHRRIETFDNDVLDTPHTAELWPSIITGAPPDVHGIHAVSDEGGASWSHPALNRASDLAQSVLPDRVRTRLGVWLRNYGATIERKGPDWYADRGVSTVFDGRRARPIGIPSYHHDRDDACGILADRGAELSDFLEMTVADDGQTRHAPAAALPELEERLTSAATHKLGVVRSAIAREYDIVFVWLAYLDTVGHLAPAADAAGRQERAYRRAASLTDGIRGALTPADTLVCVSDHGLRDGDHTHAAFLGASDERVLEGVRSVLGVRDGIERVTPARGDSNAPPVREGFRNAAAGEERRPGAVRDQLDALGYLE